MSGFTNIRGEYITEEELIAAGQDWGGAASCKRFPDGHYAEVWPMTYGKGRIALMPQAGSIDVINAWCYESIPAAMAALEKWTDPDQEPEGWMRNPQTGRRRPDGDPSKEYVRR